jgi:hypothetical protein
MHKKAKRAKIIGGGVLVTGAAVGIYELYKYLTATPITPAIPTPQQTTTNYNNAPTPLSITMPTLADFIQMNASQIASTISTIQSQITSGYTLKLNTSLIPEIGSEEQCLTSLQQQLTANQLTYNSFNTDIKTAQTNRDNALFVVNSDQNTYNAYKNIVNMFTNMSNTNNQVSMWGTSNSYTEDELLVFLGYDSKYDFPIDKNGSTFKKGLDNIYNQTATNIVSFFNGPGGNRITVWDWNNLGLGELIARFLGYWTYQFQNADAQLTNDTSTYNGLQQNYNDAITKQTTYAAQSITPITVQITAYQNNILSLKNSLYVSLSVIQTKAA